MVWLHRIFSDIHIINNVCNHLYFVRNLCSTAYTCPAFMYSHCTVYIYKYNPLLTFFQIFELPPVKLLLIGHYLWMFDYCLKFCLFKLMSPAVTDLEFRTTHCAEYNSIQQIKLWSIYCSFISNWKAANIGNVCVLSEEREPKRLSSRGRRR